MMLPSISEMIPKSIWEAVHFLDCSSCIIEDLPGKVLGWVLAHFWKGSRNRQESQVTL